MVSLAVVRQGMNGGHGLTGQSPWAAWMSV
jgi:hypothetical protein